MQLREKITNGLKEAMKAKDAKRLSTLRLVSAAIKDQEISKRAEGGEVSESDIMAILSKMVKQRIESARVYEEGARIELAEAERAEIKIIEDYLPKQLTEAEIAEAVQAAIKATDAGSLRDMGKVMGVLKEQYMGRMDFGAVGPEVKRRLSA